MAFFKKVTITSQKNSQNVVIMGRRTWEVIIMAIITIITITE